MSTTSNNNVKILGIESIPIIKEYIDHSDKIVKTNLTNYVNERIENLEANIVDGISIFTSIVFTRSNKTPATPEGGIYDNPVPNGDVWSDAIPDGKAILWSSRRVFASNGMEKPDGKQDTEWSKPANMTDTAEFEVIYSKEEQPKEPTGKFSKDENGNISQDWLDDNTDWTDDPDKNSIWMATNTAKNGIWNEKWDISKIKGEKGIDGRDGDNIEFIYLISKTEQNLDSPANSQEDDYIPEGWTDHPQGVTSEWKYEYFSMRKKSGGVWADWSKPSLWSKYGENGQDGDGVQYIYYRNNEYEAPANPTPDDWETDKDYQDKYSEYIPANYGWTDNPQGVDKDHQYEWVSMRKYQPNVSGNHHWKEFSNPTLWAKYGEVGVSFKTFTVYKRGDENIPNTPTGGSYDFETDTFTPPAEWDINDSNSNEDERHIWISTRTFASDESKSDTEWSTPIRITGDNGEPGADGSTIEFIFKLTETEQEPDRPQTNDKVPDGWEDHPKGVSETYPCEWMCTRSRNKEGDLWSDWSDPALWSKYGLNGQDGDGVQYIYCRNNGGYEPANPTPEDWKDNEEYQKKHEEYIPAGTDYTWTDNPQGVNETLQYEWVSVRKYKLDDSEKHRWQRFSDPKLWAKYGAQGPPGPQGPTGADGKLGKVLYPAGEWDSDKTYNSDENTAPYIIYGEDYYMLIAENSINDNPSTSITIWKKIEKFDAVYAKIVMIDNGTIGSAVYSGDYMFSKQGTDSSGNSTTEYQNFKSLSDDTLYGSEQSFKPNICMNFNTGKMWLNNGKMFFDGGNANLSGFIRKIETRIDVNKIDEFFDDRYSEEDYEHNKYFELDVSKLGSFIFLENTESTEFTDNYEDKVVNICLPSPNNSYYNNLSYDEKMKYLSKIRSLLGNTIYIYNNTKPSNQVGNDGSQGKFILGVGGTDGKNVYIQPGQVGRFKLEWYDNDDNNEMYAWNTKIVNSVFNTTNGWISRPITPDDSIS